MALLKILPSAQEYSLDAKDYPKIPTDQRLKFEKAVKTLIGIQLPILQIPVAALEAFEPSQIGTITGTLMDACIPQLDKIIKDDEPGGSKAAERFAHGLTKAEGIKGEREGYPDYIHLDSGLRTELKLLYVNPSSDIRMKAPPTPREPSARLTQKVTLKNIEPDRDMLLIIAYQLQTRRDDPELVSPTIVDVGSYPVIECVLARDKRLLTSGGRWHGSFETPVILSNSGASKIEKGEPVDKMTYGRKESEGKDYNEDTNFGKLKRIPHPALVKFLKKHR